LLVAWACSHPVIAPPRAEDSGPGVRPQVNSSTSKNAPGATRLTLDDLAHGLWSIANAIEAHAFQPPARQEILAAAARAVCKALDGQEPADLVHQMSTVKKEAQFAQYLRDHWLAGRLDKQGRLSSELEDALYENFHKALGKHAQFFSPKALKIEE